MRPFRLVFAVAVAVSGVLVAEARPVEPVTVELAAVSTVGKTVVTIGDVALLSGGDADTRARVARIDLAELKPRDPGVAVGRRSVEYRLALAGFEPSAVRVTGADRVAVTVTRRSVTLEEVSAAARTELFRQFTNPAETVTVELAVPLYVKLPEVPTDERVVITGKPHGRPGATGRVQMDMTVAVGGETLLSFAMHLDVRPAGRPVTPLAPVAPVAGVVPQPIAPVAGVVPQPPVAAAVSVPAAPAEILVRPRERVQMQVISGGLKVTAVGEAQQVGKLGQMILVQNVDSKKTISARVTGPGTVEVDLGGAP